MLQPPADRIAPADHPIADPLRLRWSPRTFDGSALAADELLRLMEAARWAPSSANEQPWRFLLVPRSDAAAFSEALSCLKQGNRGWTAGASLLLFTFARRTFTRSGGDNRYGWHDVGQAVASLTVQATVMGLVVHQMGGILPEAVRAAYAVPDDYDVVSAVALGRLGDGSDLSDEQRARERRPRERRPLTETVFAGRFGHAAREVIAAE